MAKNVKRPRRPSKGPSDKSYRPQSRGSSAPRGRSDRERPEREGRSRRDDRDDRPRSRKYSSGEGDARESHRRRSGTQSSFSERPRRERPDGPRTDRPAREMRRPLRKNEGPAREGRRGESEADRLSPRQRYTERQRAEPPTIYGRRVLQTILKNTPTRIKEIFLLDTIQSFEATLGIAREQISHIPVKRVTRTELDEIVGEVAHQGVAARIDEPNDTPIDDIIRRAQQHRKVIVLADEITDPHNLGALIRVADAAGAAGIILTERRSAPLSATARKSSAGASEVLPIYRSSNLQNTIRKLKDADFWIVGTSLDERASDLYLTDLPQQLCVVFGSEGKGIRDLTAKSCDFLVSVPMRGIIESLNVSTAASVVLFELERRKVVR